MTDLVSRICKSCVLRKRDRLAALLRHLDEHDGSPEKLTISSIQEALGFENPEAVRVHCTRLRGALRFYFLYCPDGLKESDQIDLPAAALDDKGPRTHSKHFKLVTETNLHRATGAAAFWQAHFVARPAIGDDTDDICCTAIVFTEPLIFRDTRQRFFIRHLDINDKEEMPLSSSQVDPIAELADIFPWITREHIVVSRGYIPGGEVLAKDSLRNWLLKHAEWAKHTGGVNVPSLCVKEMVSRKMRGDINVLNDTHCILLGSYRTNWVIRYFQDNAKAILPLKIEPDGIVIDGCTKPEYDQMIGKLMELRGNDLTDDDLKAMLLLQDGRVQVKDDWAKMSFALVSRALQFDKQSVITVLSANQGRSIQALGEHILVDNRSVDQVLTSFGIKTGLPKAFQMLFAVILEDQESGFSKTRWKPLLYREIDPKRHSVDRD